MSIACQLKACGRKSLPQIIQWEDEVYRRDQVFKHDFFAATALYRLDSTRSNTPKKQENSPSAPEKIILKWSRSTDFFGLPLAWLGQWISQRERCILKQLQGLAGVPQLIGPYQSYGLLYEYIEGTSLDSRPQIPDDFFDRLETLLKIIHTRNIAYLDLNKKGNILLGQNNKPHLIDFQISWHCDIAPGPFRSLFHKFLKRLQQEDFYHLYKHKRRCRPDLMSQTEIDDSRQASLLIRLHRKITRPLTLLRRRLLGWLMKRGQLITDDLSEYHSETDPSRWSKK